MSHWWPGVCRGECTGLWCSVCGAARNTRMEDACCFCATDWTVLSLVTGGTMFTPQDPTATFLVPFCMLTFDVTVPALLSHPLKQMFSASACSVCNWHSSARRLLSKSFQWWKGAGSITTIISTTANLFGNTAGSKPGSAADEEGKICSCQGSF